MIAIVDKNVYVAVIDFDGLGGGCSSLDTMFILSDEEPNKELLAKYLQMTEYYWTYIVSINKVDISDIYYPGAIHVDKEKTIEWINDLDEMIKKAVSQGLILYRTEDELFDN